MRRRARLTALALSTLATGSGLALVATESASAVTTPEPTVHPVVSFDGATTTPTAGSQPTVYRVGGLNRYDTSRSVSRSQWDAGTANAVVLARGDQAPDALAGVPLAAHVHGPLLLTDPATLDPLTRAEIDRALGGPKATKTIYILGGTNAVSSATEDSLRAAGYTVVRYFGATRYATALAVARSFGPTSHVIVATGQNFPDALAAGPLGGAEGAPIVLSDDAALDPDSAAFVASHTEIDAVGGQALRAVQTLHWLSGTEVWPLSGSDRYATGLLVVSREIAAMNSAGRPVTAFGVASGTAFPDALTGGAYAANAGIPMVLTAPTALPDGVRQELGAWKPATVTVFGGPAAVDPDTVKAIAGAIGGQVSAY